MPEADEKGTHSPGNSLCVVGAEALLILLPFLVIGLVLARKGEFAKFAYLPEWGVAASVLIGLSMVRFAIGLLHARTPIERVAWERVLLLFSLIVVIAFVPSLLVMSLVMRADRPSTYLAVMQVVLFMVALAVHLAGLGRGTRPRRGDQNGETARSEADPHPRNRRLTRGTLRPT